MIQPREGLHFYGSTGSYIARILRQDNKAVGVAKLLYTVRLLFGKAFDFKLARFILRQNPSLKIHTPR
tara:strand:- start:23377 stop:23580 length:204 start_codon:yes stop_codon:yes gene_type:complete